MEEAPDNKADVEAVEKGSETAKAGFQNERDVVATFEKWKSNQLAKKWLKCLGEDPEKLKSLAAEVVTGSQKADIRVMTYSLTDDQKKTFNIQVKLVSNEKGFNQIDKRWLLSYKNKWNMPNSTFKILQHFTGELPPYKTGTKDKRRMFLNEFKKEEQKNVVDFFSKNKKLIITGLLKGSGSNSAEWFMVIRKTDDKKDWSLKPVNEVIAFYSQGEVKLTPRGSLQIGKIKMQRKGGDNGRASANMLQFKINPTELIEKTQQNPKE